MIRVILGTIVSALMVVLAIRLLQVGLPFMAWIAFMMYALMFLGTLFSIRPRRRS